MREAEVDELRRADLAEASRLGEEFGLGTNARVTRVRVPRAPVSVVLTIIVLVSLVALSFIMAMALASSNWVAAVIFGVVAIGGSFAAWLLGRHARSQAAVCRFFRYSGGFIQLSSDEPGPRVLRWAEVESVTLVFNDADGSFNGLSWCTLDGSAGTTIAIGGAWPKAVVRDIAFEAERILSPRIAQSLISTYESGEPVIIGNWRIDQTGVTGNYGSPEAVPVPWSEVREITVASENYRGNADPASLIMMTVTPGKRRHQPWLSLSRIQNGMFLPRLLEHIAGRNGVPLRKTVVPPGKGG